jgi:hypothetical protein
MKVNKLLISIVIGFIVVFSAVTFSKQKNVKLDNLIYVGTDKDVVTAGQGIKPDGINDLHFQITHDFQKNDELVSVTILKTASGDSAPNVPGDWSTKNNDLRFWIIAVEANGKTLNKKANSPTLGNLSGKVKLDLYSANVTGPKYSEKNNAYEVTLTIKDKEGKQSVIKKAVTIK